MKKEQIKKQDSEFIKVALKLGFTKQDLQPITLQKIKQLSINIQEMSPREKQFYLKKKYEALAKRQNKINLEVKQQLRNQQIPKNQKHKFNPQIKKLLQEHQIALQKKARYEQIRRQAKTREAEQRKIRNQTNSENNMVSKSSSASWTSKKSIKTNKSNPSMHLSRLQRVKQKQKMISQYKKVLYLQNQKQSKRKVHQVHQKKLINTNNLKTKSQMLRNLVNQKKIFLNNLRENQLEVKAQKFKYQVMRSQYIRERQCQKKVHNADPFDTHYKRQNKNMITKKERQAFKQKYLSKMQAVERNIKEIQKERHRQLIEKARIRQTKQLYAQKNRECHYTEKQEKNYQDFKKQMKNQSRARNNKEQLYHLHKMKLLEQRIKQQMVLTNFHSMEMRKTQNILSKSRELDEKFQQLNNIQKLKRVLINQRQSNGNNRIYNLYKKFSFY